MKIRLALAAAAIALCSAPLAHATPEQDQTYVDRLSAAGVVPDTRGVAGMVRGAQIICKLMLSESQDQVTQLVFERNPNLGKYDLAKSIVTISIDVYCPDAAKKRMV